MRGDEDSLGAVGIKQVLRAGKEGVDNVVCVVGVCCRDTAAGSQIQAAFGQIPLGKFPSLVQMLRRSP